MVVIGSATIFGGFTTRMFFSFLGGVQYLHRVFLSPFFAPFSSLNPIFGICMAWRRSMLTTYRIRIYGCLFYFLIWISLGFGFQRLHSFSIPEFLHFFPLHFFISSLLFYPFTYPFIPFVYLRLSRQTFLL